MFARQQSGYLKDKLINDPLVNQRFIIFVKQYKRKILFKSKPCVIKGRLCYLRYFQFEMLRIIVLAFSMRIKHLPYAIISTKGATYYPSTQLCHIFTSYWILCGINISVELEQSDTWCRCNTQSA